MSRRQGQLTESRIAVLLGVMRISCRPERSNICTPSSSSSWRICLLTPGWEVKSASAVADTFRSCLATSEM
jgi:hypothetical protein